FTQITSGMISQAIIVLIRRIAACSSLSVRWRACRRLLPPPLWGRDGEGGSHMFGCCWTPLPVPPPQGGREPCGAGLRNLNHAPAAAKAWMPGTRPGMTVESFERNTSMRLLVHGAVGHQRALELGAGEIGAGQDGAREPRI